MHAHAHMCPEEATHLASNILPLVRSTPPAQCPEPVRTQPTVFYSSAPRLLPPTPYLPIHPHP